MEWKFEVASEGQTLLQAMAAHLTEVKKVKLRQWIELGGVELNGQVLKQAARRLQTGDRVVVRAARAPRVELPRGVDLLFEDDLLLVVNKPAGLRSMAAKPGDREHLYARLTDYVRRSQPGRAARVWIVHRLDRETSGVMVFAKTETAKRWLQAHWERVEKEYVAIVDGEPQEDASLLRGFLDESQPMRVRPVAEGVPGAREALTRYQVEERGRGRCRVRFFLLTGRRHQIRVQAAQAGWPVLGDPRYGRAGSAVESRLALHSTRLVLEHPQHGERLEFVCAVPTSFANLLRHTVA